MMTMTMSYCSIAPEVSVYAQAFLPSSLGGLKGVR